MFIRKLLAASLVLGGLTLLGCGATWHNPATGETRDAPPSYPECQHKETVYELDRDCFRNCMDTMQRVRGLRSPAACENDCRDRKGREVTFDDDDCNARKARKEGWTTK